MTIDIKLIKLMGYTILLLKCNTLSKIVNFLCVPSMGDSGELLANDKGVHREVESERSQ